MDNHQDTIEDYDNFDYRTYYGNFFTNGGDMYGATLYPLAYPAHFE